MKRILLVITGIVGALVGLGFIMPAVAWWHRHGPDLGAVLLPLILGGGLVAGASFVFAKGVRRYQA